ncbi:LOW QUALITY PROTEIN: transcription termination factor 2 [Drosophila eugracilis]|uniref:LOW QUALITY PROTEIN: transcription termination factor 2 n=1 Tax=Drosophila eugracilis TaxID=29029 RepID=UPI001BDB6310|nr:LOW QUALITY PROTEIN: transcription termination factor 2 [Drosophila eugracilis]
MAPGRSHSPIPKSPPCCSSSVVRSLNNSSCEYEKSSDYPIEIFSSSEDDEQPCSLQDQTIFDFTVSPDEIGNQQEPDDIVLELSSEYANNSDAIFVSASEYFEKKKQIDQLVQNVLTLELTQRQLEENGSSGKELIEIKSRLEKFNARLVALGEFLDTLRVEEDKTAIRIKEEPEQIVQFEQPQWSNLYSGLNRYRHKSNHSSAEFYQHKSNIIESLKILYEPSEPSSTYVDLEKQPALLTVRLLKHQQAALKWMQFRERQKISGGILADDMGLGKTLSMIALILASLESKNKKREKKQRALELQWTEEFNRLKTKKIRTFRLFDDDEESLQEEEKYEPPKKRLCEAKSKKMAKSPTFDKEDKYGEEKEKNEPTVKSPEPLEFSSDEDDLKNERYPTAGTLVVCPMSVMCQWAQEVVSKVAANGIKVLTYHGANRRDIGLQTFRSYDLVITSYNLVVSELKRFGIASLLFAVHWNRVILDEAHIIRNVKTSCCYSICQLRARCHWALTGTPVQNLAFDVFALLRFLEVPNFQDLQQWKRYLNEGMPGHRRLKFIIKPLMLRRTKQQLQESGDMPALPPIKIELICVQLSKQEMSVYQILSAISQRIFLQFLLQREKGNSDLNYYSLERTPQFINEKILDPKYMEIYNRFLSSLGYHPGEKIHGIVILVLLLRLRQFCCHPGLMIGMLCGAMTAEDIHNVRMDATGVEGQLKLDVLNELDKYGKPADENDLTDEENNFPTKIKLENIKHETDLSEIKEEKMPWDMGDEETLSSSSESLDSTIAVKLLNPQNPIFDFACPSAKLKLVIDKLEELLSSTNDKIIVTSQWLNYLAIIRNRLQDQSWEVLDFTGSMSAKDRESVLREFNENNDKRVLLLSLTAGGVGLNLNVANHMLMVDLHWNPQLERQAQDRIYRYGQKKPTFIYRYMCQDTVEQRIKALQDYKLEIAKVVLPEEEGGLSGRGGGGINLKELQKLFAM